MTTQSKEQLMDELVKALFDRIVHGLRSRGWSRFDAEGEALERIERRAQATSRGGETPTNLKQGSQDSDQLKVRATFAQESGVSRNNDGGDNG